MKYVPSIAFDEMSGSAKGVTAAKSRGRKYIRNRGYGGGVRTSAQAAVKSVFKQLTQNWKNLTNAQILSWNALAQTQAGKSVLGTASKISCANLYTRLNYWIVQTGGTALATPPTLVGVDAPAEADLDLSADAFNFQLTTCLRMWLTSDSSSRRQLLSQTVSAAHTARPFRLAQLAKSLTR